MKAPKAAHLTVLLEDPTDPGQPPQLGQILTFEVAGFGRPDLVQVEASLAGHDEGPETSDSSWSCGASDGTTTRQSAFSGLNGGATTSHRSRGSQNSILVLLRGDGTIELELELAGFTANGVAFEVVGGALAVAPLADLVLWRAAHAAVIELTTSATLDESVHVELGWEPELWPLVFSHHDAYDEVARADACFSVGAARRALGGGTIDQATHYHWSEDGAATSNVKAALHTDRVVVQSDAGLPLHAAAELTGADTTGFDVTSRDVGGETITLVLVVLGFEGLAESLVGVFATPVTGDPPDELPDRFDQDLGFTPQLVRRVCTTLTTLDLEMTNQTAASFAVAQVGEAGGEHGAGIRDSDAVAGTKAHRSYAGAWSWMVRAGNNPGAQIYETAFVRVLEAPGDGTLGVREAWTKLQTAARHALVVALQRHLLVAPPAIELDLEAPSPAVLSPRTVSPPAIELELEGPSPSVLSPRTVSPPATTLDLEAPSPAVLAPRTVSPAPAELELEAPLPAVLSPRTVSPPAIELDLEAAGLAVLAPRTVTPDAIELELEGPGVLVSVGGGGGPVTISPPAIELDLEAPLVILSGGPASLALVRPLSLVRSARAEVGGLVSRVPLGILTRAELELSAGTRVRVLLAREASLP